MPATPATSDLSELRRHPLTAEEKQQYLSEGYVVLGRVMDQRMLEEIRDEEARFRGQGGELTIFRSQLAHYSEPIRRFCTTGVQIPLACELVGSANLMLWFNQLVTKMPDAASGKSEFPWHQDNGYVAIEPVSNVTIWVALDDVDERNGCVWVMPASHRQGLLDHRAANADSWHLTLPVKGDGVLAVLKAGEAVAFTGLTLHRSKLNHTDRPRRALFMEYADAGSRFRRADQPWQPVASAADVYAVAGAAPWERK